jgi:putative phosphoesterase
MKVAVISDVHGNVKLLNSFMKYIDKSGIKKVLNLGDIMGGIDPIGVLDIIMKDERFISVSGNHDSNLTFIENELTKVQLKWLKNLPIKRIVTIEGKRFLMVHSRIGSNTDIPMLYNEKYLMEFLEDYEGDFEYVLFGHTHYQCLLSFYKGKIMINPGSLGLSYDEKMSFAIITLENGEVHIDFKKVDDNLVI